MIKGFASMNNLVDCRAFLDSESDASFIIENCMHRLCFSRQITKGQITCLGFDHAENKKEVNLNISPHFNSEMIFATRAFVIISITSNVPYSYTSSNIVNKFTDLVLADPPLCELSPVYNILGVNCFFTLFKEEVMKRGQTYPFDVCS